MPNVLYSAVFLVERTLRPLIPARSGLETMRCLLLASVLILGACSSSTEPHVGRWTSHAAMPTPRGLAVAGVIDGIVYVAGGYVPLTGAVATVEAYDPVANTWTRKLAPMRASQGVAAGADLNGNLYVAGGLDRNNSFLLATVEAYDPVANTWTTKSAMPMRMEYGDAGVVNGILYVVGAGVFEAYDPASDTWTLKTPNPTQGSTAVAGVLNDTLYLVGGYVGTTATLLTTVEA